MRAADNSRRRRGALRFQTASHPIGIFVHGGFFIAVVRVGWKVVLEDFSAVDLGLDGSVCWPQQVSGIGRGG